MLPMPEILPRCHLLILALGGGGGVASLCFGERCIENQL
jgi:hypothetical protein